MQCLGSAADILKAGNPHSINALLRQQTLSPCYRASSPASLGQELVRGNQLAASMYFISVRWNWRMRTS
jgi:hypothetical protein